MDRRSAIGAVAALASAVRLSIAAAQPTGSKLPKIGVLSGTRLDDHEIGAIRKGLADRGLVEGRAFTTEYRSADGQYDRLPQLASDLVRQGVAIILAVGGTATALAAKAVTKDIPIVFAIGGDPVKLGLVSALGRPGGNLTGATFLVSALGSKRLEVLRQLLPAARGVGFLVNPANPNLALEARETETAARAFKQRLYLRKASNKREIDESFAKFAEQRLDALIVASDAVFSSRREQLVTLAAHYRLPAIYALPEFVTIGGLASYGASRTEAFYLAGDYVTRILKGESPAELPVRQSERVEFAINLKTARALGVKVPTGLLARADQVIE